MYNRGEVAFAGNFLSQGWLKSSGICDLSCGNP